jgi:hypothetical protein
VLGASVVVVAVVESWWCSAQAQPRPGMSRPVVQLEYVLGNDASRCPDEVDFRGAVRARMGRDPFVATADNVVHVAVERANGLLTASVRLTDARGQLLGARTVSSRSSDCREVMEAATLAVSVALESLPDVPTPPAVVDAAVDDADGSDAVATNTEPDALTPSEDGGDTSLAESDAAEPVDAEITATPTPEQRVHPTLGFGAVGSLGVLPAPSFGGWLTLTVRWPRVSFAADARVDAPSGADFPPNGSMSAWDFAANLVACAHFGPFAACGLVGGTELFASGRNVDAPNDASTFIVHAGLRAAVEIRVVRWLHLAARFDTVAPFGRAVIRLNATDVWTAPWINGSLGVGAIVDL